MLSQICANKSGIRGKEQYCRRFGKEIPPLAEIRLDETFTLTGGRSGTYMDVVHRARQYPFS